MSRAQWFDRAARRSKQHVAVKNRKLRMFSCRAIAVARCGACSGSRAVGTLTAIHGPRAAAAAKRPSGPLMKTGETCFTQPLSGFDTICG